MNYFANVGQLWSCAPGTLPSADFLRGGFASIPPRRPAPAPTHDERPYRIEPGGIAVLQMSGLLLKATIPDVSFSAIGIRKALRMALADPAVRGILLEVDSVGGVTAGVWSLASEVRSLGRLLGKPIHCFADGHLMGSAYWAASGAERISATPATLVGSIGLVTVLEDSSRAFKMDGIRPIVVTSGGAEFKGIGAGAPVTVRQLAYLQGVIDDVGAVILRDVSSDRRLTARQVESVRSGKYWEADRARSIGLADALEFRDEAILRLRHASRARTRNN